MSGGGGSTPSSTTQTTRPFQAQEQALSRLFGVSQDQFNLGPEQYFPGDAVSAQSPNTVFGQQLALDAVSPSASLGINSANAVNAALDPTSAQSQALISPLIAQLQGQILPSIGSRAIQQGAFGGDRQRIQEQEAAEATTSAAMETLLRNQLNAVGAAGAANQNLLRPSQITSAVGAQQEARDQALINAAMQRFAFEQQAPQTALDRLTSRISGVNIGGTTHTVNSGGSSGSGVGGALATGAGALLTAKGLGVI